MSTITGPTGAVLAILRVQTRLELHAQAAGKPITQLEAAELALKLETASKLLQGTILAATKILEQGESL